MSLYERIKRWRVRSKQATLDQYATLSAAERAEVDELRDEHSAARELRCSDDGRPRNDVA